MDEMILIEINKMRLSQFIITNGPLKLIVDTGKGLDQMLVCAVDVRPNIATPIAAVDSEDKRKWCISASISVKKRYRIWEKKEAISIFNNKNLIFRLKGTEIPLKLDISKDIKMNKYISEKYLESLARDMEYSTDSKKWMKCGEEIKIEDYNIDDDELKKHI